jgi:hypothetical protein
MGGHGRHRIAYRGEVDRPRPRQEQPEVVLDHRPRRVVERKAERRKAFVEAVDRGSRKGLQVTDMRRERFAVARRASLLETT